MNLLYYFGQFRKLHNAEKRGLFNDLVEERLNIRCEARIFRVLTRLTFQTLQKKYGEHYAFTQDEQRINDLLQEIGLAPSTCMNWYYLTAKQKPFQLVQGACAESPVGNVCECCITPNVRERLQTNYEYRLASKRICQILVRIELFKEALGMKMTDDELRASLRRLVEHQYYPHRFKRRTRYHLRECDLALQRVLEKRQIGAMAVLKWFYVLKHHPELMRRAQEGNIQPDEVLEKPMLILRKDIQGGAL